MTQQVCGKIWIEKETEEEKVENNKKTISEKQRKNKEKVKT